MTEISFKFTQVAVNAYHVQVINIFGNIVKLLLLPMVIFECVYRGFFKNTQTSISINYSQSTMKAHCKSFGGRAVNDSQYPSMWHVALKDFQACVFTEH